MAYSSKDDSRFQEYLADTHRYDSSDMHRFVCEGFMYDFNLNDFVSMVAAEMHEHSCSIQEIRDKLKRLESKLERLEQHMKK